MALAATRPAAGSHRLHASPALRERRAWFGALLWCSTALILAFLTLPVLALFVRTSPARLLSSLGSSESLDALRLSLETSVIALAIIVLAGTPAAYLLARRRFPGRDFAITAIELPLVLPPAVAGIALLASLGPRGLVGGALAALHIELVLQTAGVVVALVFVSLPLFLRAAQSAFEGIAPAQLEAAVALGGTRAGVFFRVAMPSARQGLLAGVALAWARALGEFGATLMFAGSFQGITQTAPLAIYDQFATDLPAALALSVVLVIVSFSLLVTIKLLSGRAQPPM
ncbi:MAG TPA: molybdate ABC transporter permease subunit [Solirubrobacteraceae bacterium]|jgi:molybdate transport system permease protein|nr:molybdate ABC transporter permease subunit [Solirubrobacteraceae bacterium]